MNLGRVKKWAGSFFIALIALTMLMAAFEIGFNARQRLENQLAPKAPNASMFAPKSKRILFIADSILGFINLPDSVVYKTTQKLLSLKPKLFFFNEISNPAIRTDKVLDSLPALLAEFQPQLAIVMLGKSDHFLTRDQSRRFWFENLRIYRLVQLAWTQFLDNVSAGPVLERVLNGPKRINLAWKFFGDHRYSEAIPIFEEFLAYRYDDSALRALYFCYQHEGLITWGIHRLNQLTVPANAKPLVRFFVQALEVERSGDANNLKLIDHYLAEDANEFGTRDFYRTSLWLLKKKRDKVAFSKLFNSIGPKVSDPLRPNTKLNLKLIVSSILKSGAEVVVMQYPFDSVESLKEFLPQEPRVIFLNPRNWVAQYVPSLNISDLWNVDIEHLSPMGAEYVSEELIQIILKETNLLHD